MSLVHTRVRFGGFLIASSTERVPRTSGKSSSNIKRDRWISASQATRISTYTSIKCVFFFAIQRRPLPAACTTLADSPFSSRTFLDMARRLVSSGCNRIIITAEWEIRCDHECPWLERTCRANFSNCSSLQDRCSCHNVAATLPYRKGCRATCSFRRVW